VGQADDESGRRAELVRRFNRAYTRRIGLLDEGLLQSPFPLTAARILYELAQRRASTAAELNVELGIDPGYLSRLVRRLEQRGLVERRVSATDGRRRVITLTPRGRATAADLDARSHQAARALLAHLAPGEQESLVGAMASIERLLDPRRPADSPFVLRPHRPGDIGWIVHRHGVLYAQEYGWDARFEALVAEIAASFIRHFDPRREHCWIAEREGERAGCVMVVRDTDQIAKLRLLFVEPWARGTGLGRHLVTECIRFARQAGYDRITLWTNDVLVSARRIYERAGFRLVSEEPHQSFGHSLVGQSWELDLDAAGDTRHTWL